jgi:superfamily II DNA or RNA helicase
VVVVPTPDHLDGLAEERDPAAVHARRHSASAFLSSSFDLLIVDEAHNVAPSGAGNYALDSLRTQAIRTIAPHFEHRLFLTATPHNGFQESFTSLLELLDDQRFARGVQPDQERLAR